MVKWATREPTETAADRVESADTLPLTLRGEITLVLVGMALCGDSFRPSETAKGRSFQNMEAITVLSERKRTLRRHSRLPGEFPCR